MSLPELQHNKIQKQAEQHMTAIAVINNKSIQPVQTPEGTDNFNKPSIALILIAAIKAGIQRQGLKIPDEITLSPLINIPEAQIYMEKVRCGTCSGDGVIWVPMNPNDKNSTTLTTATCPVCHGDKFVESPDTKQETPKKK